MIKENNPYILLGVPYGCSVKEANAALAKKASLINKGEIKGITIEELTSALSQIENKEKEAKTAFRIPTNIEIIKPKINLITKDGEFLTKIENYDLENHLDNDFVEIEKNKFGINNKDVKEGVTPSVRPRTAVLKDNEFTKEKAFKWIILFILVCFLPILFQLILTNSSSQTYTSSNESESSSTPESSNDSLKQSAINDGYSFDNNSLVGWKWYSNEQNTYVDRNSITCETLNGCTWVGVNFFPLGECHAYAIVEFLDEENAVIGRETADLGAYSTPIRTTYIFKSEVNASRVQLADLYCS